MKYFGTYNELLEYVNGLMEDQWAYKVINEENSENKYDVEVIELIIDIQNLTVAVK